MNDEIPVPGFYARNKAWLHLFAGGLTLLLTSSALPVLMEGSGVAAAPPIAIGMSAIAMLSFVVAGIRLFQTDTFTSRFIQALSAMVVGAGFALTVVTLVKLIFA